MMQSTADCFAAADAAPDFARARPARPETERFYFRVSERRGAAVTRASAMDETRETHRGVA